MNKFDIVKLINDADYKNNGLENDMHGIILDVVFDKSKVLFFDKKNLGDSIIVKIKNQDLFLENEKFPEEYRQSLIEKANKITSNKFEELKFKLYDRVELAVNDEKYISQGIFKGSQGCIMEYASKNKVMVDFSGIDKNGNYYGDCILVDVNDINIYDK